MNTGIQGYRDTRIQGYTTRIFYNRTFKFSDIQEYRDTGLHAYTDTG